MSVPRNAPRNTPQRNSEDDWTPPQDSGLRATGLAILCALAIAAPVLLVGALQVRALWAARQAEIEAAFAYERIVSAPPGPPLGLDIATHGRDVFATTCVACHGADGRGVAGLGRNLVESDFVAGRSDEELLQFLITGRQAKPVAMPSRGGRDDLTDEDLSHVVAYLRGLQDPRRLPELPPLVIAPPAPPSESEKAAALEAAGGDPELAEYIASGTKLYAGTCIACHGANGVGIQGNGKALANNDFIKSLDDDALLAFIKRGRDPSDPKNTTGVGMPAKGGNPALSDDDILDIISYLRTLQPNEANARTSAK